MKVFFIASSLYILYLMKRPFRPTFDPNIDTFKIEFLVLGSFAAAMVFNYEYSFSEVSTLAPSPPVPLFSIYNFDGSTNVLH
jgi:ER lumen protein retaining receptor